MCSRPLLVVLIAGSLTIQAAETNIDVSQIIKKSDAETILGEPVKDATPLNLNTKDGYYSKCNYYSRKSGRSLILRVREAAEGTIDPLQEFDQVAASGGEMKPLEDLGDKAGMFDGTPQNGLPANVILLYVVKGKYFVTVGVSGFKDRKVTLEKARTAARKILAQL